MVDPPQKNLFTRTADVQQERENGRVNMKSPPIRPLVQLELDLQEQAGDLNAAECRALASKLARWAHQLRVKAAVLEAHEAPQPRPALRALCRRRLLLN